MGVGLRAGWRSSIKLLGRELLKSLKYLIVKYFQIFCYCHQQKRECKLGGYQTLITTFYSRNGVMSPFPVLVYYAREHNSQWLGPAPLDQVAAQVSISLDFSSRPEYQVYRKCIQVLKTRKMTLDIGVLFYILRVLRLQAPSRLPYLLRILNYLRLDVFISTYPWSLGCYLLFGDFVKKEKIAIVSRRCGEETRMTKSGNPGS